MWKNQCWFLLFILGAVTVFAQTEADFKVGLTNDYAGAIIIKYIGAVSAVNIPATIQGFPVREIGAEAFKGNNAIISVVIPEGVTVIQGSENPYVGAFKGCEKLAQVTLPSTLKSIGAVAFMFCPVKSIVIPEGITQIGHSAFRSCEALTSVTLPSTIKEIGEWAFGYCTSLNLASQSALRKRGYTGTFDGDYGI
jgi:hypothetical protein